MFHQFITSVQKIALALVATISLGMQSAPAQMSAPQITPVDQNPQIFAPIRNFDGSQQKSVEHNRVKHVNKGQQASKLYAEDKPVKMILKVKSKCNCAHTKDAVAKNFGCTVTVQRYYCHLVDAQTPVQICYWVPEEYQGAWNAGGNCCEVQIDGSYYCVRPSKSVKVKLARTVVLRGILHFIF